MNSALRHAPSFGDPRCERNEFVAERYAPTLAARASMARLDDYTVRCVLYVDASPEVTVPHYPDVNLEKVLPEENSEAAANV